MTAPRPTRQDVADRVAGTVLGAAAAAQASAWTVATVVEVHPGAGSAGVDLAVVEWLGARLPVPHGEHYAPAVGDVVLCARPNPSELVIVQRIVGGPR